MERLHNYVSPPPPYRDRHRAGLAMYSILMAIGAVLLAVFFIALPALEHGARGIGHMMLGALFALPAATVYLAFARMLDRYDPEPTYALVMAVLWGGIAACGFSVTVNSVFAGILVAAGNHNAEAYSAVLAAPLVEETCKGAFVLGVFFFLRDEFDGVIDGILYATFCAIGFAAVENILYYARAFEHDELGRTLFGRGILAPWGHPLYTSMTGIGLGLAREGTQPWIRRVAPLIGFVGAIALHFIWNGSLLAVQALQAPILLVFVLLLWFGFLAAFIIMVVVLVRRRARIIREFAQDEIALGRISPQELELTASLFGTWTARLRKGSLGVEFLRSIARLSLMKWHTTRAQNENKGTRSLDFVVPLRARIDTLRAQGASPVH